MIRMFCGSSWSNLRNFGRCRGFLVVSKPSIDRNTEVGVATDEVIQCRLQASVSRSPARFVIDALRWYWRVSKHLWIRGGCNFSRLLKQCSIFNENDNPVVTGDDWKKERKKKKSPLKVCIFYKRKTFLCTPHPPSFPSGDTHWIRWEVRVEADDIDLRPGLWMGIPGSFSTSVAKDMTIQKDMSLLHSIHPE